jgi:hypothetical protein
MNPALGCFDPITSIINNKKVHDGFSRVSLNCLFAHVLLEPNPYVEKTFEIRLWPAQGEGR